MAKKHIAVLFGGTSTEHEVSRMSVTSILRHISQEKYEVVKVGINKKGEWFLYQGPVDDIITGDWEHHPENTPAFFSPDRSVHGLMVLRGASFEIVPIDAVIPVLHGKNGEDGTVQGLLELAGIPYVGCDPTSSAACMDKVITNIMLDYAGIPQARFTWLYRCDLEQDEQKAADQVERDLQQYPVFVKPANAGSSVGVSKASNREELIAAMHKAAKEDRKILIEENIIGQEVECAVLGNDKPVASQVGEIAPSSDFYDYDDKYINGTSGLYIPAHLNERTSLILRERAVKAYRLLGCSGLARVDFFVRKSDGEVLLNELNTLPGFTSISMYPKLKEADGVPMEELLDQLIQLAFERAGQHE